MDDWDMDNAEWRPAVKSVRAIVSVPFSRQEFEAVAKAAEAQGLSTSAYIRRCALSREETVVRLAGFSNACFALKGVEFDVTSG